MYGAIARMRGQARRAEAAAPNGKGAEDAEEADLERIAAEEADPDPAKAPNAAEANS
jgi:hypothetical protein